MQKADTLRKFNEQNKAGQSCSRGLRLWQQRGGLTYWVVPEAGDLSDVPAELSRTQTSNHYAGEDRNRFCAKGSCASNMALGLLHIAEMVLRTMLASLKTSTRQQNINVQKRGGVSVSNVQHHPDATAVTPSKGSDDKATHEGFNSFLLNETQSGSRMPIFFRKHRPLAPWSRFVRVTCYFRQPMLSLTCHQRMHLHHIQAVVSRQLRPLRVEDVSEVWRLPANI